MKTKLCAAPLAVLFLLVAIGLSLADSGALSTFTAKYGNKGINTCSLCHTSAPALNPYGAALGALPVTVAVLTAAEPADSDSDGSANIVEINAGTYPGDPGSKPASPPPSACTYTYSAWSACQPNNTQTRTVTSSTPAGCTGTPALTQPCTYTPPPPPPGTSAMELPDGRHVYTYGPIAAPVVSTDPAQARPMGIGPIATGGDVLDLKIQVGPFPSPVDVSLGIYAASFDAKDIYFLDMTRQLISATAATAEGDKEAGASDHERRKKIKKLTLWKSGVTEVNESVFGQLPAGDLEPGLYVVHLGVSPVTEDDENHDSYRWITYFIVP